MKSPECPECGSTLVAVYAAKLSNGKTGKWVSAKVRDIALAANGLTIVSERVFFECNRRACSRRGIEVLVDGFGRRRR